MKWKSKKFGISKAVYVCNLLYRDKRRFYKYLPEEDFTSSSINFTAFLGIKSILSKNKMYLLKDNLIKGFLKHKPY